VGEFVRAGGGYIGICAGSYLACKGFSWGLGIINAKTPSPKWQRGRGLVKIELNDQGRAILGDIRGETDWRYGNGPLLVPAGAADLPPFEVLASFRTEFAEHGSPKGIMINSPAVIRSTFGKGRVLCISPHPEQTEGLETVIPHAVAWVAAPPRPKAKANKPENREWTLMNANQRIPRILSRSFETSATSRPSPCLVSHTFASIRVHSHPFAVELSVREQSPGREKGRRSQPPPLRAAPCRERKWISTARWWWSSAGVPRAPCASLS
jgi:hypothetical protein